MKITVTDLRERGITSKNRTMRHKESFYVWYVLCFLGRDFFLFCLIFQFSDVYMKTKTSRSPREPIKDPLSVFTPPAVRRYQRVNFSPQCGTKKGESNESVTQTAARWGSLEENGRMTSVASRAMAAPGPPEAWDTRQVQVRKINRWRDLFLQPCRPPSKKRPPVKAAVRLDRESGPFCTAPG